MTKTFADYGINVNGHHGQITTTCPSCSRGRVKNQAKCLSVNVEQGVWKCHHCDFHGSLKFKQLPDKQTYKKPPYVRNFNDMDKVYLYFNQRGLSKKIVDQLQISHQKYGDEVLITFPFFRNGECINIKYRGLEQKTFRMAKNAERILYNLDGFMESESDTIVITEGEIDTMSIIQSGFGSAVVSVPNGAPSAQTKDYSLSLNYLESAHKLLESVSEVILAVDGDEPGEKLKNELARRIGIEKCLQVKWPEGCKDANDVLMIYGADALRLCIESAKPFPIEGLFTAEDLHSELEHLYDCGEKRGVLTGWGEVDKLYTIRPKEWTIVTGVPSHGKTAWLNALLVNIAKNEGWRFGMYSPENQPIHHHIASLMQLHAGQPFEEGWGAEKMSKEQFQLSEKFIKNHFTFILPSDNENHSLDNVLRLAKASVLRHGINGLVIDPWNELDHTRDYGMTETEHISQSLTKIRQFARIHDIHVWVVAHPQKMYRSNEGIYPMPTLYDIAGSAHFRNKTDNGIVVHRENFLDFAAPVTISVQKVRFRAVGHAGTAKLYFNGRTGEYTEC